MRGMKKLVANGRSHCACCGKLVPEGQWLVQIDLGWSARTYIRLNCLLSWAGNAGDGDMLALDKKRIPDAAPVA